MEGRWRDRYKFACHADYFNLNTMSSERRKSHIAVQSAWVKVKTAAVTTYQYPVVQRKTPQNPSSKHTSISKNRRQDPDNHTVPRSLISSTIKGNKQ